MMKRLYICFLLLAMVSTAVIAQDVQQKDDAKKEAKATKPKNEKKAKEPKAKKEKEKKGEKASPKVAVKTTVSSKTSKKIKKNTPEYEASLKASKIAMDSILKYRIKDTPDDIMNFADIQCEKFGWDPVLMDSIAESFYTIYNNEVYGERRYSALKKMHPEYTEAYLSEARLFHSMAWYYENGDPNKLKIKPELLEKCKIKIDSAKILMPNSAEPYMLWVRLQAQYKHYNDTLSVATIDEELEALKKKLPDYPGYLDAARYYEDILAKKDKNFLLDAAEYYEKAGERNELSAAHWNNFALLVYQYPTSFDIEDYGIKIANKGLEYFPNYPRLLRAKLWNLGAYKKWDKILEMSETYFEKTDTLEPSFLDYKFLAKAYENQKNYVEAINEYKKEIELLKKDTAELLNTLKSLANCYNRTHKYDDAILTFQNFESIKRETGQKIDFIDYQYLRNSFYGKAKNDSTISVEARIQCYDAADSVCVLACAASPEECIEINDYRLNMILRGKITLQNGAFGQKELALPEFLEAAERITLSVYEKGAEKKDIDYFYLMEGLYWMFIHYYVTDNYLLADEVFGKMNDLDMPYYTMLTTLNDSYKNAYNEFLETATKYYGTIQSRIAEAKRKKNK